MDKHHRTVARQRYTAMKPLKLTPSVLVLLLRAAGLPMPEMEHRFAPPRRWRFDVAWPAQKVALEIQGGVWTFGRHVRGAAMLKEWEKLNAAAATGWRILYCQPRDVITVATIAALKAALDWKR